MNDDNKYVEIYNRLEEMKIDHPNNISLIEFCQQCLTDDKLEYLPNEVSIHRGKVMFDYEEDNGDHLMVAFNEELASFESKGIEYYSFKKNSMLSNSQVSWNDMLKLINEWHKETA